MRINNAIAQCAEAGWTLFTDDTHTDKNGHERATLICHIYMVQGDVKIRLCTWSELFHMSRATFTAKLAQLPREQVATHYGTCVECDRTAILNGQGSCEGCVMQAVIGQEAGA